MGECSTGDYRTPLWKKIWLLKLPAKVRIFAWRACMNGLPTLLNLGKREVSIDALCPLCGKDFESTTHALIRCSKNWEVWWNWQTCPINLGDGNLDILDAALRILEAGGTPQDLETFFVTAWLIWYNRNKVINDSPCLSSSQIWGFAQRLQGDYKGAITANFLKQLPY